MRLEKHLKPCKEEMDRYSSTNNKGSSVLADLLYLYLSTEEFDKEFCH